MSSCPSLEDAARTGRFDAVCIFDVLENVIGRRQVAGMRTTFAQVRLA